MKSEKVKYYKQRLIEKKQLINYFKQAADVLIEHNNELKAELNLENKTTHDTIVNLKDENEQLKNAMIIAQDDNQFLLSKIVKLKEENTKSYNSKTHRLIAQIDIDGYTKTINDLVTEKDSSLKEAKVLKQEYAKVFNLYSTLLKQKEHYETALNTIDLTITCCNKSICDSTTTD